MEPYDSAWEHRTGCLERIIGEDHVVERLPNVRISSESFSLVDNFAKMLAESVLHPQTPG